MNWKVKSLIQRSCSKVPGGDLLYFHVFQSLLGQLRNFSPHNKISQGLRLLEALYSSGNTLKGKKTMEIGTGWIPVVPIIFFLAGQESCNTYDNKKLLKEKLSLKVAHDLSLATTLRRSHRLTDGDVREKLNLLHKVETLQELLQLINLSYHAPADARNTGLSSDSMDIVYSNVTLEHINPADLRDLFAESYRILVPDGLMLHLVDCGDHYSHGDKNITPINFLKYSPEVWDQYNSPFCYQNRLRSSHYQVLFKEAGFETMFWEKKISQTSLSKLNNIPLAGDFINLKAEDICTTSFTVVAKSLKFIRQNND